MSDNGGSRTSNQSARSSSESESNSTNDESNGSAGSSNNSESRRSPSSSEGTTMTNFSNEVDEITERVSNTHLGDETPPETSPETSQETRPETSQETPEETPYEWLEGTLWQVQQANEYLEEDFDDLISCSNKYQVSEERKTEKKIDLRKVFKHRLIFIPEMETKKSNSYDELENAVMLLKSRNKPDISFLHEKKASFPLIGEIIDKIDGKVPNQDKSTTEERYTAGSLPDTMTNKHFEEKNLDVKGYVLKVSVPENKKTFLEESGFTSDERPNLTRRWIFIPSYKRANCGLFDWSKAGIDEENTIRIIVVRPSEFEEYQKHCGNYLPIISLPVNETGVGYARYWIQQIATSLGLEYIWMIDDDVKQFYEVHPKRTPPGNKYDSRRRRFDGVFTKFESIVKDVNVGDGKLVAISPIVFDQYNLGNEKAFVRKPPRAAVFLNLKLINEKGVSYRPQLGMFEDMLFGKECEKKDLKVIMWRRIQVYCITNWSKTGCSSPRGGGGT